MWRGVHRWNDIRTRRATRAPLRANSSGHWNATVRASARTGASWSANGSRSTRVRRVASRRCATCPTDPTAGPRLRRSSFVWRSCSCSWEPSSISYSCRRRNDRPPRSFPLPRPRRPLHSARRQTPDAWQKKSIHISYFYRLTCSPRGLPLSTRRWYLLFPKKKINIILQLHIFRWPL